MAAPLVVPPLLTTPSLPATPTFPTPPQVENVSRFEVALATPHALAQDMEQIPQLQMAMDPGRLGDRILAGIDRMRDTYQVGMEKIQNTMATPPSEHLGARELMQVFFDVSRLMMQQEMLGKIVGKTTQNVDTLLKGQ